jgi:hypothetical protein
MVFWYILWTFGIFCGNLIWCIFPVLVFCTKKNLATLVCTSSEVSKENENKEITLPLMYWKQKEKHSTGLRAIRA